jgi:hypothetical protein
MKTKSIVSIAAALLLSALNSQLSTLFAQGTLTPPGAPAPTMKSLDQIEPRTPISSLPFNITRPGSYYLTTNFTGISGTNGITISSGNVSLDLRGFTLAGAAGALDGILVAGTLTNITIENGIVSGWPGDGVEAANSSGSQFSQLSLTDNGADGLDPGINSIIRHCIADGNTLQGFGGGSDYQCTFDSCTAAGNGNWGFAVKSSSLLVNCDANNNAYDGFFPGSLCTLRDCTAVFNSGDGFNIPFPGSVLVGCASGNNNDYGFQLSDHSTVQNCNASYNNADGINTLYDSAIESCTAGYNQGQGISAGTNCAIIGCASSANAGSSSVGILAGDGCTIKDCVTAANPLNGIVVGNACFLEHNLCKSNGGGGATDGGILCNGSENRVDENHLTDNNRNGLYLAATNNTVIRNSAKGNTTNYSVGVNNDIGPIGSAATSTSPWANLQ